MHCRETQYYLIFQISISKNLRLCISDPFWQIQSHMWYIAEILKRYWMVKGMKSVYVDVFKRDNIGSLKQGV